MKTFTDEEITRELNCYPVAAGINKGGDIMRQLKRERDDLRARLERAEGALRSLTDEAQILVNIIHCNTDTIGRCRLSYDMTIGTGKAIEAAHASMSSPSAKPGEKEEK